MTDIEDSCEQYLQEKGISYIRNKKFYNGNIQIGEFDFIICGAIIEIKNCYSGFYSKRDLLKQITRFKKYIPSDFTIYLFAQHDLTGEMIDDFADDSRVKVISDFSEIEYKKYPYYTTEPSIIRSFGVLDEEYHRVLINGYPMIHVKKDIYDRAMAHFTDEEFKNAEDVKYVFIEAAPTRCIIITNYGTKYDCKLFDTFLERISTRSLINNLPQRLIEGVTTYCIGECKKLYYVDMLTDNKCHKCLGGKRKRCQSKKIEKNKRIKISKDDPLRLKREDKMNIDDIVNLLKKGLSFREIKKQLKCKRRSPVVLFVKMIREKHKDLSLEKISEMYKMCPDAIETVKRIIAND